MAIVENGFVNMIGPIQLLMIERALGFYIDIFPMQGEKTHCTAVLQLALQ